jgi:hypothetical protein
MCAQERGRRERESVCVRVCEREREKKRGTPSEREGERACVRVGVWE